MILDKENLKESSWLAVKHASQLHFSRYVEKLWLLLNRPLYILLFDEIFNFFVSWCIYFCFKKTCQMTRTIFIESLRCYSYPILMTIVEFHGVSHEIHQTSANYHAQRNSWYVSSKMVRFDNLEFSRLYFLIPSLWSNPVSSFDIVALLLLDQMKKQRSIITFHTSQNISNWLKKNSFASTQIDLIYSQAQKTDKFPKI